MRSSIIVLAVVLVACCMHGCAKDEELIARVKTEAVAASVSATQLVADYKANEVKADLTYKDKVVQVSGKVHKIEKDLGGHPVVILVGEGLVVVRCVYDKAYIEQTSAYSKGETVTVKGICEGKFGSVNFRGCMPL